jgi:hypothetical protein
MTVEAKRKTEPLRGNSPNFYLRILDTDKEQHYRNFREEFSNNQTFIWSKIFPFVSDISLELREINLEGTGDTGRNRFPDIRLDNLGHK